MAFFSNQGIQFAQGVGADESTPACALCDQEKEAVASKVVPGFWNEKEQTVQTESGAVLVLGAPKAHHDGIFAAQNDPGAGPLQAHKAGSLGLPLYIDGRLVTRPITIHHGPVSGLGSAGCGCGCSGVGCDDVGALPAFLTDPVSASLPSWVNPLTLASAVLLGAGVYFKSKGK